MRKLCIPYNGTDGVGGGWTTWCPEVNTNFTDFSQIQLSANIEVVGGGNPAATGFIGCYLSNYTYSIADNAGDGIWFSFVSQHDRIAVFGSDVQAHWGSGQAATCWCSFGTAHCRAPEVQVDLVCTDDRPLPCSSTESTPCPSGLRTAGSCLRHGKRTGLRGRLQYVIRQRLSLLRILSWRRIHD